MDEKEDLRVSRTKKQIYDAFFILSETKLAEKITVKELADLAKINKSTFYLHYKDMDSLTDEILDQVICQVKDRMDYAGLFAEDPRTFIIRFADTIQTGKKIGNLLTQSRTADAFHRKMLKTVTEQIYASGKMNPTPENDIKIEFILHGLCAVVISCYPDHWQETLHTSVCLMQSCLKQQEVE